MEIDKEEIREWFSNQIGIPVTDDLIFFDGLHMEEDELEVMLFAFVDKYGIDLAAFNYQDYVPSLGKFLRTYFYRTVPAKKFTINHIFKVAEKQQWFDPM